jgi:hypothetical protein
VIAVFYLTGIVCASRSEHVPVPASSGVLARL